MSIKTVPLRPLARAKARNYRKHRSVSPTPAEVLVPHAAESKLGSAQYTFVSDIREEAQILSRPPRYFEAEEEEARAEEAAGLPGSKDTEQISGRQSEYWSTERGLTEPQAAGVPIASGFGFRMLRSMGWVAGQGLGLTIDGISEPIAVTLRPNKSGVGFSEIQRRAQVAASEEASDEAAVIARQAENSVKRREKEEEAARMGSSKVEAEAATQVEEEGKEVRRRSQGNTHDLASISYEALIEMGAMVGDMSEDPYSYQGMEGEQLGEEVEGQSGEEGNVSCPYCRRHFCEMKSLMSHVAARHTLVTGFKAKQEMALRARGRGRQKKRKRGGREGGGLVRGSGKKGINALAIEAPNYSTYD